MHLVACAWLVVTDQYRRGCTLSPRQNVAVWFIMHYHLHLHAFLPTPTCTSAYACSTHILFDLSMAMSGSGRYLASLVPAISKVCACSSFRCCLFGGQQLSEGFQGISRFYTPKIVTSSSF